MSRRNTERTAAARLLLGTFPEHIARCILVEMGTPPAALAEFEEIAAIRYARELLDKKIVRRSISYRLSAKYEISQSTAYRRISAALNLPRNLYHGRPDAEN